MKKFLGAVIMSIALLIFCASANADIVKLDEDTLMVHDHLDPGNGDAFIEIVNEMLADGETEIQILINSPGGLVKDCFQIIDKMDALQAEGIEFTTVNIGEAASAAGFIWINGDVRQTLNFCQFMFHRAAYYHWFGLIPYDKLTQQQREDLRQLNYEARQWLLDTVHDTEIVNKFLGGEYGAQNWFTVWEMNEFGLIDGVLGPRNSFLDDPVGPKTPFSSEGDYWYGRRLF